MKNVIAKGFLLLIFVILLVAIIGFSRGYRLNVQQKSIVPTGILVASSFPNGAKVYVNGVLKGATDTNVQIPPGKYTVEIKKEGYITWKKIITVKGEIVVKTDSLLFPQNPSLSPVTSLGIVKSYYSPTTNQIILISKNEDPLKDGIYVLETTKKTLSIFNPLKRILAGSFFPTTLDLEKTEITFSPDGKQIIVTAPYQTSEITPVPLTESYLLSTEQENLQAVNITKSKETVINAWTNEEEKQMSKIFETYKEPISKIASDSFKIIAMSPDDSKLLYSAKTAVTLPLLINPPLIGSNERTEQRSVMAGHIYVYDKKEDKNYEIPQTQNEKDVIWYPDSRHLIIKKESEIAIMDYDGGNEQTVYSGPFLDSSIAVSSEGNLLILANLNPTKNKLPDVYTVGIR
jgi:hypothetical protein